MTEDRKMKKVYAVSIKNGSEGNDVCALMGSKQARTAFPGCWECVSEEGRVQEEVIDRISGVVNEFIDFPDFDCVVFGCSEAAMEDILKKLRSDDIKRLNVHQLAEFIGII